MKESITIEKPHLVENYVQRLMSHHIDQEDTITFPKVRPKIFRWSVFKTIGSAYYGLNELLIKNWVVQGLSKY